ncbi:MAG: MBL fold metallo-hydrolase [Pseudomonadota bacterium]
MTEMVNTARRGLMLGAAALPLAGGMMAGAASAAVPAQQGVLRAGVYRFKVGAFEVTSILDGAVQLDGPHPIFGQNVTQDDVAALAAENFLPPSRFEIPFTVTLVNTGSELILFDTGNGDNGRRPAAGKLVETLGFLGIQPGDVTHVVITHFHGDHISGLTEGGQPTFPNAAYVFGAAEFDFWSNEDLLFDDAMQSRAQLVQDKVVPFAEQATMIKPGDAVRSGIEAVDNFGHTPGHMAYHLESEGARFMITADSANHYVMSLQRPDWHVRFDMDKEKAAAARKSLFGMIAADKIPFIGYHMPPPAVGYVEPLGQGFRYVPASYQLNL